MTTDNPEDQADAGPVFAFFTEVGIINQLATAMLAGCLPDGVHPSHFGIVNHLCRVGDGTTPVRLAVAMQVTKTTMSHSIKVLEERGFIRIEPSPEDGRAKLVFVTRAGRAFRKEAIQRAQQKFGAVLTRDHLAAMTRVLDDLESLRRHLDANR